MTARFSFADQPRRADAAIGSVQWLDLSDDERTFLAISRADLAIQHGDSAAAVSIYREALALPGAGKFAQRQIVWRLAAPPQCARPGR